MDREQLTAFLTQQQVIWDAESTCFIQNHPGWIRELERRIAAVTAIDPAEHATKSRDYGRGFAEAIRQVREALGAT